MAIIPIKDNVVVEPVDAMNVTSGGLHLPESRSKGAISEGVVISVGPKVDLVKAGQTVIFDKHSPTLREVKQGATSVDKGRRFLIMKECDLIAVYE